MDDEISGMFQVAKILEELDEEARARVIRWAADKFGVDLGQPMEPDEDAIESADESMPGNVDPKKVVETELEVKPASSLEQEEAPTPRDPSKPSFMDTSFRMFSGKQELKKAKDDK